MTFKDFIAKWRDGTLGESATWRAYDFEGSVLPRHVRGGLRLLGLGYAGDHAFGEFMQRYGLSDAQEATTMLGSWWLLVRVEGRGHMMLKPRR